MSSVNSDQVLPPNLENFPDGSILRIVFHNFLTYEHTTFIPTANLNMILGHNGSGKSSIICGICLACGGNPKSLGRSERIIEYIRHGCTEGYVEIAIADKDRGPQIVRLTIEVGKSPEYRLNNMAVTQSDIDALRKQYNIQIDNPCAFLAQDKVKSFSEQSAIELLKNTEKAASADLDRRHIDLVEQRKDSTTIEDKCKSSEKAVRHLENEIAKIMPLVENYRKKLALQSKLRLLEKKMKCLEFEIADADYKDELKKMDEILIDYKKVDEQIADIEASKKRVEEIIKKKKTEITKLHADGNGFLAKIQENTDKRIMGNMLEREKVKLESIQREAEQHMKDAEKVRKLIEQAQGKLQDATGDLDGYEQFQERQRLEEQKYSQAERDFRDEEDAINKKTYEKRQLENKKREVEQNSQMNRQDRYRSLQAFNSDSAKAYRWYQQNRNQFKGDVYMPIIDMVLKNQEASKALENCIGMRDRAMLVCQFKEDELLINGKQHSWRISTTVVSSEKVYPDVINAQIPPELKDLGFKFLVSNCFDAPSPLKQYLCNVSGLNRIPYGGSDVDKNTEDIGNKLETLGFSVFLTNNLRCQISRSKYGAGGVLHTQTTMRDPLTWRDQFFRKSPVLKKENNDVLQKLQTLKDEIDVRTEQLSDKRRAVQKERDVLRQEQMQWKTKKQVQTKWKTELAALKGKLDVLENEHIDVKSAENEYKNAEKKAIAATREMLSLSIKWHKQYEEKFHLLSLCEVSETLCKEKINKLNNYLDSYREKLKDLKNLKDTAEDKLKMALDMKIVACSALIDECNLQHLNEEEMGSAEKKIWDKLKKMFEEADVPADIDHLHQAIRSEKTRLKLAEDNGEDGCVEHEQQLEHLTIELTAEKSKQEKLLASCQNLHNQLGSGIEVWRKEVEIMIERINENYVKFFEALGCRGEVSLEQPENILDIEKYGIMIMVCFRRGENMKRLDNKVQSGGERSVATMLYLLALQQLCPVPFRCIDEINQGMDPTNERKVFNIMVGLWNGTSGTLTKTQYFLLSPKLLHGLDMRENVNIVMANSTLTGSHGNHYDTSDKIHATFAKMAINS